MKIQNSNLAATSPVLANPSGGPAGTSTKGRAASISDEVQLSHLGSALSAASTRLFATSNRIDDLTKLVRSGSYAVDPLQLSRRLIEDAQAA